MLCGCWQKFNGLAVYHCNTQPTGLHASCDACCMKVKPQMYFGSCGISAHLGHVRYFDACEMLVYESQNRLFLSSLHAGMFCNYFEIFLIGFMKVF